MRSAAAATLLCAALVVPLAAGQDSELADRQAVLAAVQEFFDAMTACDAERARKVLDPAGRFFRLGEEVTHFDNATYLETLVDCGEVWVERMWDPEVRIHDGMAMVWAPYDLWRDGQFHHCGVDLFNLVDGEEGWRIVGGAYTVETADCPESPLGPLAAEE